MQNQQNAEKDLTDAEKKLVDEVFLTHAATVRFYVIIYFMYICNIFMYLTESLVLSRVYKLREKFENLVRKNLQGRGG